MDTDTERGHSESAHRESRRQGSSVATTVLAVLAVLYTLYFARAVILPIVFSIVVALILRPVTRRLEEIGLPIMLSALLVVGGAGTLFGVGLSFVVEPAGEWISDMPDHLSIVGRKLEVVRDALSDVALASSRIEEITEANGEERPVPVQVEQPAISNPIVGRTGALLVNGSVSMVLVFFLLARIDALTDAVLGFLEVDERRERVRAALLRVEGGLSRYLFTVTVINSCLGLVTGTALWLLGMPNPVLWGIMAMFLNYVPFLGAWTGTLIVGLVAAVSFSNPLSALAAPLVFLLLTSIEGNLITPMILGRSMSLDPLIVFASLVVFGWMWGVVGAILAVPILAIAKSACEQFEDAQSFALLIGGQTRKTWGTESLVL